MTNLNYPDNFWDRVNKTEFCWVYRGPLTGRGYGSYKGVIAHRFAYVLLGGLIPTGHDLHHICKNKLCVNPAHLETVLPKEHVDNITTINSKKTHCKNGHEYTKENTMLTWNGLSRTGRRCRICWRERSRMFKKGATKNVQANSTAGTHSNTRG